MNDGIYAADLLRPGRKIKMTAKLRLSRQWQLRRNMPLLVEFVLIARLRFVQPAAVARGNHHFSSKLYRFRWPAVQLHCWFEFVMHTSASACRNVIAKLQHLILFRVS